jgi:uncharacterized membrane protein
VSEAASVLELALRTVHIVAGIGWLGEVLVVVFVLGPALRSATGPERIHLLARVFPLIFRLATVLGGVALLTGLALLWMYSGFQPALLFGTAWGRALLAAGSLALGLYGFHLVVERRLLRVAQQAGRGEASNDEVEQLAGHLGVIPLASLAVLLVVATIMVCAAHFA